MRLRSIALILCLCFQPLNSFSQNEAVPQKTYDFSGVVAKIQEAISKKEIPSMVVAISRDGRIIYEDAFGYADIEEKVPATVNTAYRLASVSDSGYKTMWHEGGMPGASSFIKLIPAERISVAAITNVADKNQLMETVANELVKVILPSYQPEPLNATANYKPYDSQADYQAKWTGSIYVQDFKLPCSLAFKSGGELHIVYGNSSGGVKAQEATFKGMINGKSFMGSFPGTLPSDDLQQNPPQMLVLHLIREGNILSGRIAAYCGGTSKLQYLYPFYVRLERAHQR